MNECDRCGARALWLIFTRGDGTLYFCQHHKNEHAPALIKQGYRVLPVITDEES